MKNKTSVLFFSCGVGKYYKLHIPENAKSSVVKEGVFKLFSQTDSLFTKYITENVTSFDNTY